MGGQRWGLSGLKRQLASLHQVTTTSSTSSTAAERMRLLQTQLLEGNDDENPLSQ